MSENKVQECVNAVIAALDNAIVKGLESYHTVIMKDVVNPKQMCEQLARDGIKVVALDAHSIAISVTIAYVKLVLEKRVAILSAEIAHDCAIIKNSNEDLENAIANERSVHSGSSA